MNTTEPHQHYHEMNDIRFEFDLIADPTAREQLQIDLVIARHGFALLAFVGLSPDEAALEVLDVWHRTQTEEHFLIQIGPELRSCRAWCEAPRFARCWLNGTIDRQFVLTSKQIQNWWTQSTHRHNGSRSTGRRCANEHVARPPIAWNVIETGRVDEPESATTPRGWKPRYNRKD